MCAFETRLCLEQVVEPEAAAGEEEAAICPVPTIGPYSLPPLAEPPPPASLDISLSGATAGRRAARSAGGGAGQGWGSGRDEPPAIVPHSSLRAAPPAQSSGHPAISNDPRRSPVECQRRY